MKRLLLFLVLVTSINTYAYNPMDTIVATIKDEYGAQITNIEYEINDAISSLNNALMNLAQKPIKKVFKNNARNYEVLYKVSFTIEDEKFTCRAVIKSKTRHQDSTAKVYLGGCGLNYAELITSTLTSDVYTGPQFVKSIKHKNGEIIEITDLAITDF